ncbi:AAA family ATPase [Proteiniphilum sp.]|uniref:AAA family ATPase n=1 Tax=Proteiniphilum sp. TaxID=1926877 RepID=UPI00332EE031
MEKFTDRITIENFKSIRRIELEDCRWINLLIGKPNVGKSNALEAFSSFCLLPVRSKRLYRKNYLIWMKNLCVNF